MATFLSMLPLAIITLFIGFAGLLIIDDEKRHKKKLNKES